MDRVMNDCLFCKIINKELSAKIVYEDDEILAFHDIRPKTDIHYLIIPKQHIASLYDITVTHAEMMGNLLVKANEIAVNSGINGYKILINNGVKGGQEVFHIHLHLLANK
ncbi:MAG: histidine triad nucleotide-binding protein [Burkholderiales bacterium]|nr:histidine triad nucleotide-binding protein [Burkholderiales bacterium]